MVGDKGAETLANSNLINLTSLNLYKNSISRPLTAEAILASLKQKREMIEILNRVRKIEERHQTELARLREENQSTIKEMEEKLNEESQNRLREMEERYQPELTRLREENQNTIKEMEERYQTELARVREESQDGLKKVIKMFMKLIQNVENDLQKARANQQQAQAADNDQTTCPDSQLGEVHPISRDQSLSSSRSSGSECKMRG